MRSLWGAVLLVSLLLLWVATAACVAVAWAIRPQPGPDRPWPKWTLPMVGVAMLLMLVAIPAAAIYFSASENASLARGGIVLTEAQRQGREAFAASCKRCHTLADAGAPSTIGPNFDLFPPNRDTVVDAVVNGRARGNGQMPRGLVDRATAEEIADYLDRVAGR